MKKKSSTKDRTSSITKLRWVDVAYRLVDGVLGLLNSNKAYPAFALVLLVIIGIISWRLPESDLGWILKRIIENATTSSGTLIGFLVLTNIGWYFVVRQLKRVYQAEIARLINVRQALMHGKVSIQNHRSSSGEQQPTMILPADE